MIIHKLIRRGTDHKNYAEDSLACKELENFVYACVFDGCSKGIESHFASTLFAKAFNDTLNGLTHLFDNSTTSLESQARMLLFQMARKVREVQSVLNLDIIELMATIVLCIVDKNTKSCYVVAIGDGYFRVDDMELFIQNTKFVGQEQSENKPDYIAYDLNKIQNYSDFELWFSQKKELHLFENVTDITISSDGMNTFSEFKNSEDRTDPVAFLVRDEEMLDNKIMLDKKYNILQSKYGVINKDDLGMIRIKLD